MPIALFRNDEIRLQYDIATSASVSATNHIPLKHPISGLTTIILPTLTGSASTALTAISVDASNARTLVPNPHTVQPSDLYQIPYDKYNGPTQSDITAINDPTFPGTWVSINSACIFGPGFIIIQHPFRFLRLSGHPIVQLTGGVSAGFVFHDNVLAEGF